MGTGCVKRGTGYADVRLDPGTIPGISIGYMNTLIVSLTLTALLGLGASQHQHAAPQDRANHGMGFDQDKTIHHFVLEKAGGTIEVTAKDASDKASTDQIRSHLAHIARAFADGDFALPIFIHDTTPPGVTVLKERRAQMTFRYEAVGSGGKVVIRTSDAQALEALHDFLRFQIREHKTGDPMTPR